MNTCPGRRVVGGDLSLQMRSTSRSDSDPETIAIWIDKVDFTTPRLVQNINPKLLGNRVDVIDPQVDEGIRARVPGVFWEEQTRRTASRYRREHWKSRFKGVFPLLLIAKPGKPSNSIGGVWNSQNWYRFIHAYIYILDPSNGSTKRRYSEVPQYAGYGQNVQVAEAPPMTPWVHPHVVVNDSGIERRGLFATKDLLADEIVLRLSGRLVSTDELVQLIERANADRPPSYVDTLTIYEDAHLVLPIGTMIHFGNHSCDPNLW
jgi:hypothetical protein